MSRNNKRKTTEQFIKEARDKHGDKYDYSQTEYLSAHTKLTIICPKHGPFTQEAKSHLRGNKCPKCSPSYHPNSHGLKKYLLPNL